MKGARGYKQNLVFFTILGIIVGVYLSGFMAINTASPFSGTTKTMGDDFVEVQDLNASGDWFRGTTNLTDRLLGDWGSTNLDTTGYVNASEFYLQDENRTGFIYYRDDTPSGLDDHEFSGDFIIGTAGENLAIGELTFLDSDGKYWKSDSNSSATMYVVAMALESITADGSGKLLIDGYLRDDSWAGWTVGSESPLYVGWSGGDISQTVPNTSGDQVQIIGYPIASKIMRFDPDSTVVEIS